MHSQKSDPVKEEPTPSANDQALIHAVEESNVSEVRRLLDAKANPHVKVDSGYKNSTLADIPIIIKAVENNNIEIVRALLEAKASPDTFYYKSRNYTSAIFRAVALDYDDIANLLLDDPRFAVRAEDDALEVAMQFKKFEIAEKLIDAKADVNRGMRLGVVPLYSAISKKAPPALIKKLIDAKATISDALGIAIQEKNLEAADILLEPEATFEKFFFDAIEKPGKLSILQYLLDKKANPNSTLSVNGYLWPALLQGVQHNSDPSVINVLVGAKADVNYSRTKIDSAQPDDKAGLSPLMAAVGAKKTVFVHRLLELKADVNVKYKGKTLLQVAKSIKAPEEIIQLLNSVQGNKKRKAGDQEEPLDDREGVKKPKPEEDMPPVPRPRSPGIS